MSTLGVVSDEVCGRLPALVGFVERNAIEHVEINFLEGFSASELPPSLAREAGTALANAGAVVGLVGSRCFRHDVTDTKAFREDLEDLRRSVATACLLGVSLVRVFSFVRMGRSCDAERVAEQIAAAADVAAAEGAILLVENTASGTVATTAEIESLFRDVAGGVGLLWDPANAVAAGDRVPQDEAMLRLRRVIRQLHAKNAELVDGRPRWCPIDSGLVDYRALASQLEEVKIERLTMDTHWRAEGDDSGMYSTLRCLEELRTILPYR